MQTIDHPVWIELSRKNLEHNWRSIQKVVGDDITIIPMIKSNGYGHGGVEIGTVLQEIGMEYAGVSSLREARELRQAGIKIPLLIADYVIPECIAEAIKLRTVLTISDPAMFTPIEKTAKKLGKKIPVEVHIDTGMHRESVWSFDTAIALVKKIHTSKHLQLHGLYTHFATVGDPDPSFAYKQLEVFNTFLNRIETLRIPLPRYIHVASGAAIMRLPEGHKKDPNKRITAVRPGNLIYGLPPGDSFPFKFTPKRVLTSIKARLGGVKTIPEGDGVSYGLTWRAKKASRIGIVFSGYTDGYRRALSNKGHVLVGGKKAPIIGMVAMNQTVIKLPDKGNFKVGDEVVIVGKQGKEEITLEYVSELMGTIMFEYLAELHAKRLPRVFKD